MKTEAIQKINKMGKISCVIALICKILLIIGMVLCLIGAVLCFVFPEEAIKVTRTATTVTEVDYGALGITVPEEEKELLEQMQMSDDEWRVETTEGNILSGTLEIGAEGKSYVPTGMSIVGDTVKMEMLSEEGTLTIRDAGVMVLVAMAAVIMTFITFIFISGLCKAFRDCESPFEENVIKKMQRLAIALIPWTVISSVTDSVLTGLLSGKTEWSFVVDMGVVLVNLIVFVLVYIFKYGAVLQQESDETL
uniref:hypothetical protein n=1 Tax=Acetatifactor sp. TaxID=1872090 RepID=UPI0040577168